MGLKKGFKFKNPATQISCPVCGRTFATPQALQGHLRFTTCGTQAGVDQEGVRTFPSDSSQSVKQLEAELKELQLRRKIAELSAGSPQGDRQPPDLMAQAGLGQLSGEAQQIAQKRALGINGQPAESWFTALLKAPGGLENLVKAAKGILGVPSPGQGNGGSGTSAINEVLGLLGYGNLREFYLEKNQPRGPAGFRIGNVSLEGAALTPEIIIALLAREDKLAEFEYRKERDGQLGDGLKALADAVKGSGFIEKVKATWNKGGIAAKPKPEGLTDKEEPVILVCPECGAKTSYCPSQTEVGQVIKCSTEGCGFEGWEVKHEQQIQDEEGAKAKAAQEAAKQGLTVSCSCGQLIDVANIPLGSKVACPVCGEEILVVSPTEAMPPAEAKAET